MEQLPGVDRGFGIGERLERLPLDDDRSGGASCRLRVVGGDDRHRLAPVAGLAVAQDRLILIDLAEGGQARHVVLGEHGAHPRHGEGGGDVEPGDAGPGVGAAPGGAPQHPVGLEVRRVGEVAGDLGDPVGAPGIGPDSAADSGSSRRRHGDSPVRACRARRMPPYPVQRQMLPDNASRISGSVGSGCCCSR